MTTIIEMLRELDTLEQTEENNALYNTLDDILSYMDVNDDYDLYRLTCAVESLYDFCDMTFGNFCIDNAFLHELFSVVDDITEEYEQEKLEDEEYWEAERRERESEWFNSRL